MHVNCSTEGPRVADYLKIICVAVCGSRLTILSVLLDENCVALFTVKFRSSIHDNMSEDLHRFMCSEIVLELNTMELV